MVDNPHHVKHGYLQMTRHNAEDDSFTLGYPDREVREGGIDGLLNSYSRSS